MDATSYAFGDVRRWLLGQTPLAFLLETLVRTAITYVVLIVMVRLLGKRMGGQITNFEMGVMIALGAIAGGAFQLPDRGLIPTAALLTCLLAMQRGLSALTARYPAFERRAIGVTTALVEDGLLLPEQLRRVGISQRQLLSVLRGKGVRHLGELKRVYLERTGSLSVVRERHPRHGLTILPAEDDELQRAEPQEEDERVCSFCGRLTREPTEQRCRRCGRDEWQRAIGEARQNEPPRARREARR